MPQQDRINHWLTEEEQDAVLDALQTDTGSLEALSIMLGKPRSAVFCAAKAISENVFGDSLEIMAPNFYDTTLAFRLDQQARIEGLRLRKRIIKELQGIIEDLELLEGERTLVRLQANA